MSKLIIFDWGGIVESHENNLEDLKAAQIRLIRRYNKDLSSDEIINRWTNETTTGVKIGASNNPEDLNDWVQNLQKRMDINVPFSEFKEAYEEEFSHIKYYRDVVHYAHSLKKYAKIAILSNLTPFDKKRINDQYDLSKFDYVYLSFEIGMRKPDAKVYEYVLQDTQVLPKDILFIDDDSSNILMAEKYGWQTCQAFGYELSRIKETVEQFLNQ
ncbi:MAG: HAD-IA family hydrolase [Bacilli bacterium]|nr:HAD-IA family hydrolase [Bacilli bacterium]